MADMTPQGTQAYGVESGYERGDANVRSIVQGLAIIFTGVVVVMAAMFGMFNFLNRRIEADQAKTPVALTQAIVPPEPRLLPSPHTDEAPKAAAVAQALGEDPNRVTADGYPWDKRNLEIGQQYNEANSYGKNPDGSYRIPIKYGMQKYVGTADGGTPASMSWMSEHPRLVAGENGQTMNLEQGHKQGDERIYDYRAVWEAQDEKYTPWSSGGASLKAGEMSR